MLVSVEITPVENTEKLRHRSPLQLPNFLLFPNKFPRLDWNRLILPLQYISFPIYKKHVVDGYIYIYICCTFTEYAFKFCKLARIIAAVAAKENTPCFPVEESKKKKKCSFMLDRSLERKDSGWFFRWPIMPKGGGDIAPVKKKRDNWISARNRWSATIFLFICARFLMRLIKKGTRILRV